jgi:hypothetical protein
LGGENCFSNNAQKIQSPNFKSPKLETKLFFGVVIDNVLATSSMVGIKPLLIRQMKILNTQKIYKHFFCLMATKKFGSFNLATEIFNRLV